MGKLQYMWYRGVKVCCFFMKSGYESEWREGRRRQVGMSRAVGSGYFVCFIWRRKQHGGPWRWRLRLASQGSAPYRTPLFLSIFQGSSCPILFHIFPRNVHQTLCDKLIICCFYQNVYVCFFWFKINDRVSLFIVMGLVWVIYLIFTLPTIVKNLIFYQKDISLLFL